MGATHLNFHEYPAVPGNDEEGGTGTLTQDRRISPRFSLQMPIKLVLPGTELKIPGTTRDIAAGGIFIYADAPLFLNEEIDLLLNLPFQSSASPIRVACHAKILRLEQDNMSGKKGIAVAIQKFDFLTDDSLEEIENAF